MKCISPLVTLCSPLLLLRPVFSQCRDTWNINTSSYKDLGWCKRRGPVTLVWEVVGSDDKYDIHVRKQPFLGYSEEVWAYSTSNKSVELGSIELKGGQEYYVTFNCRNKTYNCDKGRFDWHFVECGCPAKSSVTSKCEGGSFTTAKDVQCLALTPPPTPPPLSKLYNFKYEVKDFEFGSPPDFSEKQVWSESDGIIKNCAYGATTDHEVKMSLVIGNSQSMTVSKSFTSSKTNAYAAGVSITATAEAGVIFAKASVAAEASFEYSREWTDSNTVEDSSTMETSSDIGFELATVVSVEPNTCIKYTYSAQVSSEPLAIPYTAKTYLTVFHKDENEEQVDLETLQRIQEDVFLGYDSTIDTSSRIVYPIDGVFEGRYATRAKTETSNCDECDSNSPPADESSSPLPDTPSSPQPNVDEVSTAAEDSSSVASVLGLGDIAVGIMSALTFALN